MSKLRPSFLSGRIQMVNLIFIIDFRLLLVLLHLYWSWSKKDFLHSNHLNEYVQNLNSSHTTFPQVLGGAPPKGVKEFHTPDNIKRLVKILCDNLDFLLNGELISTKSVLQQVSCKFFDSTWKPTNKNRKKIASLYNLDKEFIDNEVKRSVHSSNLESMDPTFNEFEKS